MKKLIATNEVEIAKNNGDDKIYINSNTIITPAAKDLAISYGIEILIGTGNDTFCNKESYNNTTIDNNKDCNTNNTPNYKIDSELIFNALKIMMEKGELSSFLTSLTKKCPLFCEQKDISGLKVVVGNSVQMDKFDTGNINDNVYCQEVVNKDESSISSGFLTIEGSSFKWQLKYDEVDYVIDGSISVSINGRSYTANKGDVIHIPKGSNVVFSATNKAKLFFAVSPSNWANI